MNSRVMALRQGTAEFVAAGLVYQQPVRVQLLHDLLELGGWPILRFFQWWAPRWREGKGSDSAKPTDFGGIDSHSSKTATSGAASLVMAHTKIKIPLW